MHKTTDLCALVIRLQANQDSVISVGPNYHPQVLFLELIRRANPTLSHELHQDIPNKPFTVSVLSVTPSGHGCTPNTVQIDLRVTLLQAKLVGPVTQALSQHVVVPIGHAMVSVSDIFAKQKQHLWAGSTSVSELIATVKPAHKLTLEFVRLTAFGQGSDSAGKKRLGMMPSPETVFGSLARRWNDLMPSEHSLTMEQIKAATVDTLVSSYHLETQMHDLGVSVQKGFIGTCTYELSPDPMHRQLLTLLADASFYLGIGIKTARGMGLCRRIHK
ncbi:MAG: CRISPR system precrRNA processing endoribonuclease RAMP protein Cas6 [Chloroflexi bacterium AL-W]|nr:CRISPR system precrRNA processing endoribonuclease RAMP protein Cas6 [Chloroflexi bacterium AL-N1]NOK68893.1 CRISPR system precrRNA processing endoribonuclease RAMP protein Cas6 [Chloroflexi bacterium AL-N10]NOK76876.1 CRISPR system precrRNA processing endoribonuclease RAMP protein Cas6 [Chloroflexi bacterium AL-N5]NOK82736.1 CRISPR system precrRNA processing endoribonuclease RAMP protein Cas6 [Chloroflexi bacterium AL-W]NOK90733.1 CRISPR system precrRNA processing endoribonuclease RAMP prot